MMWTAVIVLTALAGGIGGLLAWASHRLPVGADDGAVERLNALLPQAQCGQCGYPGCRPYARALLAGEVPPDRCPPGGDTTARRLADELGAEIAPLPEPRQLVAWVDESACIGCTRCIEVCPVDAIIGAHRRLHTVIARDCTGCELCVPACPVDCIELRDRRELPAAA